MDSKKGMVWVEQTVRKQSRPSLSLLFAKLPGTRPACRVAVSLSCRPYRLMSQLLLPLGCRPVHLCLLVTCSPCAGSNACRVLAASTVMGNTACSDNHESLTAEVRVGVETGGPFPPSEMKDILYVLLPWLLGAPQDILWYAPLKFPQQKEPQVTPTS